MTSAYPAGVTMAEVSETPFHVLIAIVFAILCFANKSVLASFARMDPFGSQRAETFILD